MRLPEGFGCLALVVLVLGILITGTAIPASTGSIRGIVVGPDGLPRPGALVGFSAPRVFFGCPLSGNVAFSRILTDGNGRYLFEDVVTGTRTVSCFVKAQGGPVAGWYTDVQVLRGATTAISFREDGGATLAGTVLKDNRGAGGKTVEARRGPIRRWTETDDGGRYVIRGLAPGTWKVTAGTGDPSSQPVSAEMEVPAEGNVERIFTLP